ASLSSAQDHEHDISNAPLATPVYTVSNFNSLLGPVACCLRQWRAPRTRWPEMTPQLAPAALARAARAAYPAGIGIAPHFFHMDSGR
ncbi:hypothetical protein, partial [Burkholderia vietnamiensis]|uniref:hypothetical protein n=1 Tax=Burkholderia vietnamiensis TaxID=60552 RepID=UPI001ABA75F4